MAQGKDDVSSRLGRTFDAVLSCGNGAYWLRTDPADGSPPIFFRYVPHRVSADPDPGDLLYLTDPVDLDADPSFLAAAGYPVLRGEDLAEICTAAKRWCTRFTKWRAPGLAAWGDAEAELAARVLAALWGILVDGRDRTTLRSKPVADADAGTLGLTLDDTTAAFTTDGEGAVAGFVAMRERLRRGRRRDFEGRGFAAAGTAPAWVVAETCSAAGFTTDAARRIIQCR